MITPEDDRVGLAIQLLEEAQYLILLESRHEEALTKLESSEPLLRALKQDHPEDDRPAKTLASLLYSKGRCLAELGRPADALAALSESEQGYVELRDARGLQTDKLIADVRARRGLVESELGRGASAVLDLDAAITTYLRLLKRPGMTPELDDLLNLARVASINASVLRRYGDPNLAVISADHAITVYFSHAQEINRRPMIAHMHAQYLRAAAGVAVAIHAVHQRLEIAVHAADLYIRTARTNAQDQSPASIAELAEALAWMGLIGQARGGDAETERCLPEARSLDGSAARRVEENWQAAKEGRHPLLNTLSSALEVAAGELGSTRVSADLARTIASPPTRGSAVFTPSARCSGVAAPAVAQQLAELATDLLPSAPEAALRLGLEAHYLFAAVSREQTATYRYRFSEWTVPWARALLACSRTYRDRGDLQMAVDLGDWCQGVAEKLIPFAIVDPKLRPLLEEIEIHQRDRAKGSRW